jgi:hypothetical protein
MTLSIMTITLTVMGPSTVTLSVMANGTPRFQNINNCLNTNIYSYLETSGGQSSNPYLNVVHFLNARAD